MRTPVQTVLEDPGRRWSRRPPAAEEDLLELVRVAPVALPDSLLELLRASNGGEGDVALPPLIFVLDSVERVLERLRDPSLQQDFPGFVFFGGNGGLERIALDCRANEPPWPIVMIDPVAGPESAEEIAPDMAEFVAAIGLEYQEESEGDA